MMQATDQTSTAVLYRMTYAPARSCVVSQAYQPCFIALSAQSAIVPQQERLM